MRPESILDAAIQKITAIATEEFVISRQAVERHRTGEGNGRQRVSFRSTGQHGFFNAVVQQRVSPVASQLSHRDRETESRRSSDPANPWTGSAGVDAQ